MERLGLDDLEAHIEEEMVYTRTDWEQRLNIYEGATFNLGHQLSQMMTKRPPNQIEVT